MLGIATVLALFIGVLLGMLGGGGSVLLVPVLLYVLKLAPKDALATSQGAGGLRRFGRGCSLATRRPIQGRGNQRFKGNYAWGKRCIRGDMATKSAGNQGFARIPGPGDRSSFSTKLFPGSNRFMRSLRWAQETACCFPTA